MLRFIAIGLVGIAGAAQALDGKRSVNLLTHDGEEIRIATLTMHADDEGWRYELAIEQEPFGDYFLSMRPFRCIAGGEQVLCHLPYPYPLNGHVTEGDWRDLEYRLMFLFKARGEYGINFEDGYYFKLERDGDGLTGHLHEANMNDLASPPPKNVLYPFGAYDLFESEGPWIKELRID